MARGRTCAIAAAALLLAPAAANAKAEDNVEIVKCEASLGSIAVVDGDAQGWTKFGLGSPRELIMAMAVQSGCFTPYDNASGRAADFLANAVAGDKEEVDQSVSAAKSAMTEVALRSGMLGRIPIAGGMLGMMGGLGGKKKTVAAGLRILSPMNGQTLVSGTGIARKSVVTFGGGGNPWADAAQANISSRGYGDYLGSQNGQMLVNAFAQAFNAVVAQGGTLSAAKPAPPPPAVAATPGYVTAIDTQMYAQAAKGTAVRALRAATELTPTGKREGLFLEVTDGFGTQGWVSVEDLK